MRISRDQMFMSIARCVSMRSTCARLNVGAIMVGPDHNILSMGYNGSLSGQPHCSGNDCPYYQSTGCQVIHAEINAFERAPVVHRARLYVTHSPCQACARLIIDNGIKTIFYETEYRLIAPIEFLIENHVTVYRVLPSGYLLNKQSGIIVEV